MRIQEVGLGAGADHLADHLQVSAPPRRGIIDRMEPRHPDLRDEILALVDEDDYGLWEIVGRVTAIASDLDLRIESQVMRQVAEREVRSLVRDGAARILVRSSLHQLGEPVSAEAAIHLLNEPESWKPPSGAPFQEVLLGKSGTAQGRYESDYAKPWINERLRAEDRAVQYCAVGSNPRCGD